MIKHDLIYVVLHKLNSCRFISCIVTVYKKSLQFIKHLAYINLKILKACDTRSDKLDENCRMRQVGWKIVLCVIPYHFCCVELDGVDGTYSDSYDVINHC